MTIKAVRSKTKLTVKWIADNLGTFLEININLKLVWNIRRPEYVNMLKESVIIHLRLFWHKEMCGKYMKNDCQSLGTVTIW